MNIEIGFPGGVRVEAHMNGHVVASDQPEPLGRDTAASPFDLFFASIATCMGFYALRFCQERSLPTAGLALNLTTERNPETKHVDTVRVQVRAPNGFPEKYEKALYRAIDHCAVKRHVIEPPRFEISVSLPAGAVLVDDGDDDQHERGQADQIERPRGFER